MATIKTVVSAVASVVNGKGDKAATAAAARIAAKASERKVNALAAFCLAYHGERDAAKELSAQELNAWEHYAMCIAYGASFDEVRDTLLQGIEDQGERDVAAGRCRVYKGRVSLLLDAGETLLTAEGVLRTGLGQMAKDLEAKRANKGGKKRGTKGRGTGKGTTPDAGESDAGESDAPTVTPENVAITDVLIGRVLAVATAEGEAGEHIRAMHGEGFAKVAGMVALAKLKAAAIVASQGVAKARAAKVAKARVKADAKALAQEAKAA